jgi:hypothetical protein
VSYIGRNSGKKQAQLRSMELHIRYIRSLGDSPRVRARLCHLYSDLAAGILSRKAGSGGQGMPARRGPGGKANNAHLSWEVCLDSEDIRLVRGKAQRDLLQSPENVVHPLVGQGVISNLPRAVQLESAGSCCRLTETHRHRKSFLAPISGSECGT